MTRHLDAVKTLCQAISGLLICRDILKKDKSNFIATNSYVSHFLKHMAYAKLDEGMKLLLAARCGGIWTAQQDL